MFRQDIAAKRARRLRRKRLAEKVVAHWKSFAREGIAEARARAHASAAPTRRALARWRAGAAALRSSRLRRSADAGRRRFIAESRGFATWAAAARANRDRRHRLQTAAARSGKPGSLRPGRSAAALSAARALNVWRDFTSLRTARRGMEVAALRTWASGRLYAGLAGLRRSALKHRLDAFLIARGDAARRRLLGLRGLGALRTAVLRASGERDVAAEAVAWRARATLARWGRRVSVLRARRAILAEQVFAHESHLRPGKLRRAIRGWRRFCTERHHYRKILANTATVCPRALSSVPAERPRGKVHPAPPPPSQSTSVLLPPPERVAATLRSRAAHSTATAVVTKAGRAQAAASLRKWRLAVARRHRRRAAASLAEEFRDHVLLLRHHEHWKAFSRRRRAAAQQAAAAARLARRACMRRALLGLERAAEDSAAERDRARPRLREAFLAWGGVFGDGLRKKERRAREAGERERRVKRRILQTWLRRTQATLAGRDSFVEAERQHRRRRLRGAMRNWAVRGVELRLRREQMETSRVHSDRRRVATGVQVWRAAAADIAIRRSANEMASHQASKSLSSRILRAWKERSDLQAARKAVFSARVASAATVVAEGKLQRSFARWREVHGSARVATITRLRADAHARRKLLGKFLKAWKAARDLQERRKTFRAKAKARRQLALQRQAFEALASAAEASRRQREKVSSALLLWKLHTQGKAFAVLAAHRLRRRWKQDRARRAVGWRRERLIKDGALRWAATADALSASRISSAAFREGNKAARRWEAAGRCARHWRRVAAARGMERRALDQSRPNASLLPRETGESVRGLLARGRGLVGGKCAVTAWGGGRPRRPAVRADETDAPDAHERRPARERSPLGRVGKENRGREAALHGRHSDVTGSTSVGSAAAQGTLSSSDRGRNFVQEGVPEADTVVASGRPEVDHDTRQYSFGRYTGIPGKEACRLGGSVVRPVLAASSSELPGAKIDQSFPLSAPAARCPFDTPCGDTREAAAEGHVPFSTTGMPTTVSSGGEVGLPIAIARVPGRTASDGFEEQSSLSFGGSSRDDAEGAEHREPPSPKISVRDLTRAALPYSGNSPLVAVAAAGGVGASGGQRRPAPRRPLELLLDETSRFAAASSGRGQRSTGVGGEAVSRIPPPPLSTWVVEEMNRLFGVRGALPNTSGHTAFGKLDRGREHVATLQTTGGEGYTKVEQIGPRGGGDGFRTGQKDDLSFPFGNEILRRAGGRAEEEKDQHGQGTTYLNATVSPRPDGWRSGDGRHGGYHHQQHRNHDRQMPSPVAIVHQQLRPQPQDTIPATARHRGDASPSPRDRACRWSPPDAAREVGVLRTIPSAVQLASSANRTSEREALSGFHSSTRQRTTAAEGRRENFQRGPCVEEGRETVCSSLDAEGPGSTPRSTVGTGLTYPAAGGAESAAPASDDPSALAEVDAPTADVAEAPDANSPLTPRQSSGATSPGGGTDAPQEQEEKAIEARVAEAERRLLFLQERARQRRQDKRELAALHQALADQEGVKANSGGKVGDKGKDGADGRSADGDGVGCLNDSVNSDGPSEREDSDAMRSLDSSDTQGFGFGRQIASTLSESAPVDGQGTQGVSAAKHSPKLGGSGCVNSPGNPPAFDDLEHDLAPKTSDTSSRRALLVRMGLVRARLDSRGREDEGHRPVAESLLREVEELSKSDTLGGRCG
ncbi:unnamed protein product [Scytosiphon promiscuus]